MSKECFYSSSLGRKVFMAITGAFLVIFMLLHLTLNLFVLGGEESYNAMTHFMALPFIKYGLQPVLALGFIIHIIYGLYLAVKNSASVAPLKFIPLGRTLKYLSPSFQRRTSQNLCPSI